jgi:hypothetical protein
MKPILTVAAALALGLTLCGTAKANIGDGQRSDLERIDLAHSAQFDRDGFGSVDPWWFEFDGDEIWESEPWWFWFDGNDLRYFEHRQFIADAVIPTG